MENNKTDELVNLMQQGITNEAESIFIMDEDNDKTISSLQSKANVKVSGVFRPKTAGKYLLEASLKYREGTPVSTTAEIMVITTALLAIIVDGLKDEVVTDSLHAVHLLVKNNDEFTATVMNIETGNLVSETIKIRLKNKEYSLKAFNELPEEQKKLKKGEQIQIKGTYKAKNTAGKDTLGVRVNYRVDENTQRMRLSFDEIDGGSTNVISKEEAKVIVKGSVSPQEMKMKLNGEEMIEFTFENTNDKYPATGVEITIKSTENKQSEVKKN